jgi:hypothetical protein
LKAFGRFHSGRPLLVADDASYGRVDVAVLVLITAPAAAMVRPDAALLRWHNDTVFRD